MLKFIIIFYFISLSLLANEEYFLTLRNDKVNLRLGPSFDYPIKIIYKKKYLPVIIKDRSDNFRKIQDHENNSGWIHISQLSKKKSGITIREKVLYKRPTVFSKPLANVEKVSKTAKQELEQAQTKLLNKQQEINEQKAKISDSREIADQSSEKIVDKIK